MTHRERRFSSSTSMGEQLTLDAGRAAFGKRFDFVQFCHRYVAGEGREQRAVGPAEAEALFRREAANQSVDQSRRKSVAAADAVDHVEIKRRADVALAVEPEDAPAVQSVLERLDERFSGKNKRGRTLVALTSAYPFDAATP